MAFTDVLFVGGLLSLCVYILKTLLARPINYDSDLESLSGDDSDESYQSETDPSKPRNGFDAGELERRLLLLQQDPSHLSRLSGDSETEDANSG
mgnify:CR=1 FL=1